MLKIKDNVDLKEDNFIYRYTQQIYTDIVSKQEKVTIEAIEKYCRENGYIPNIIEKEKLDIILKLGINEYEKRFGLVEKVENE